MDDAEVSEKSDLSLNFRSQDQFKQWVSVASICQGNFTLKEKIFYGPAYVLNFSESLKETHKHIHTSNLKKQTNETEEMVKRENSRHTVIRGLKRQGA